MLVENRLPFGEGSSGEDRVEDGDERAGMGPPRRRGGEARIGAEVRPRDGGGPRSASMVVATGPAMKLAASITRRPSRRDMGQSCSFWR